MKQKLGSSMTSNTAYVPGPGHYGSNLKNKRDSPKYGFGSSNRDALKRLNVPGPGSYKLKSSIGDVPEYAMPQAKIQQYKYV